MFESSNRPKALEETIFYQWLEKGRASKIPYTYLLIIWDELENEFIPQYLEDRTELNTYKSSNNSFNHQILIAAYDIYSETRIL